MLKNLERPVLVTGPPRSGKSLLCEILNASPEFTWVREPKDLWALSWRNLYDDCWGINDVSLESSKKIHRNCTAKLRELGGRGNRYLDDLALHSLRFEATLKIVPDARFIFSIRDPALSLPELVSYWKGKNVAYAIRNRFEKKITLKQLPQLGLTFLKNRAILAAFGRLGYVGPVLPEVRALPYKSIAVEMASQQLDAFLSRATEGLNAIPKEQKLQVKFESLCLMDCELLEKILEHCEISNNLKSLEAIAKKVVKPAKKSIHWLELTPEEKKIAEPVIEKWRSWFAY